MSNYYGKQTICIKCQKPTEKPRLRNVEKAVCLKCQAVRDREYHVKARQLKKGRGII